jgi:putative membrane protein
VIEMMGYYGAWSWGSWLGMTLTMLATWGLIAWLVVLAMRGGQARRRDSQDARRILDERFARGELSEEQYQRARSVLQQPTHSDTTSR